MMNEKNIYVKIAYMCMHLIIFAYEILCSFVFAEQVYKIYLWKL